MASGRAPREVSDGTGSIQYKRSASGTATKCIDNSHFYSKYGILPIQDSPEKCVGSMMGEPSLSGGSIGRSSGAAAAGGDSGGVRAKKLTKIYDGATKFPKLEECAHFHYDFVELGALQVSLAQENQENHSGSISEGFDNHYFSVKVFSQEKTWVIRRTYENFRTFDKQLHKCIYDRKYSLLPELRKNDIKDEGASVNKNALHKLLHLYLHRFSLIAGNMINCGSVLSWLELDNRGHHLIINDESAAAINTPAVAAAHVTKRYIGQAQDEISLEVGDIISLIDMPPVEESQWWRGKRGFEVGFFPSDCVEVIGDKIPQSMTSKIPETPPKPVLRKRGKLISLLRSFFTSRPTRTTLKRTGIVKERVFGCDLGEHLLNSAQDVPLVLRSCAETIEAHGIVDGIYRLSGVASNIQRLRNEFDEEQVPDLTAEVYMQDIHSISSLLKMYFRELPNPLLTYQLYDKFAAAVQDDDNRLGKIHDVVQQLPPPHYRTAEFLFRHLARVATSGRKTGMHCKNLAIVWAPNLMRCKELELLCNTAALQGVGIQAIVTEFLISYADLIFSDKLQNAACSDAPGSLRRTRPKSLAISTPTKLLSLEEAREQILRENYPSSPRQKYIDVGGGPENLPAQYHTIIDVPSKSKKSRSSKAPKSPSSGWKSLFSRKNSQQGGKDRTDSFDMTSPLGTSAPAPGLPAGAGANRALTEADVAQRGGRKLRSVRSADSLLNSAALRSSKRLSAVADDGDTIVNPYTDEYQSVRPKSLERPSPGEHKRAASYDYSYHSDDGSFTDDGSLVLSSTLESDPGAVPRVHLHQHHRSASYSPHPDHIPPPPPPAPSGGGKYLKKGKKSKKMHRSRSMGQDNGEAPAAAGFPTTDGQSPPRPTPPLLPGATPRALPPPPVSPAPAPMETMPLPPTPPSPGNSFYEQLKTNSPTLTEAIMSALTPTSPRKKIKAPEPPVVPMSASVVHSAQTPPDSAQYYEEIDDYRKDREVQSTEMPDKAANYESTHSNEMAHNDVSPDNGISDAIEDLRPKHLSPIEEMIPVELMQSPGASRHLVSKLSRSYDDIEMAGLEGASCEMASVGNFTEDEVFHQQNQPLTTDSENETDLRRDAMAQRQQSSDRSWPDSINASHTDRDGYASKYDGRDEYPTSTDYSDTGTMDTLRSNTTGYSDNTLCPTEMSKSLESMLKDIGSDFYQSGSEFDNTNTDSSSRFESCTTGSGQYSSNSDSDFRQGMRLYEESLRQHEEATAAAAVAAAVSSSEEDTLRASNTLVSASSQALETDIDSVDMACSPTNMSVSSREDMVCSPSGSAHSLMDSPPPPPIQLDHKQVEFVSPREERSQYSRPSSIPLHSPCEPQADPLSPQPPQSHHSRNATERFVSPKSDKSSSKPSTPKSGPCTPSTKTTFISPSKESSQCQTPSDNRVVLEETLLNEQNLSASNQSMSSSHGYNVANNKHLVQSEETDIDSPCDDGKPLPGVAMYNDGYMADRSSSSSPTLELKLKSAPISMPGIQEIESPVDKISSPMNPSADQEMKSVSPDELPLPLLCPAGEAAIEAAKRNMQSSMMSTASEDLSQETMQTSVTSDLMFALEDIQPPVNDSNDDVFASNGDLHHQEKNQSSVSKMESQSRIFEHQKMDTTSDDSVEKEFEHGPRKKGSPVKRKKSVRELLSRFEVITNSPPSEEVAVKKPVVYQKAKVIKMQPSLSSDVISNDTPESEPEIPKCDDGMSHSMISTSAPTESFFQARSFSVPRGDVNNDVTNNSNIASPISVSISEKSTEIVIRAASNTLPKISSSNASIRNKIKAFETRKSDDSIGSIDSVSDTRSSSRLSTVSTDLASSPPLSKTSPKLLPKPKITPDKMKQSCQVSPKSEITKEETEYSDSAASAKSTPLNEKPVSLSERRKAFESFSKETKPTIIIRRAADRKSVYEEQSDTPTSSAGAATEPDVTCDKNVENDDNEILKPSELFSSRSRRSVKSDNKKGNTVYCSDPNGKASFEKFKPIATVSTDESDSAISSRAPPTVKPKQARWTHAEAASANKDIELHISTTDSDSDLGCSARNSVSVEPSAVEKTSGGVSHKLKQYGQKSVIVEESIESRSKRELEKENVKPSGAKYHKSPEEERASVKDLWQRFERKSVESVESVRPSVERRRTDDSGKPWSTIL